VTSLELVATPGGIYEEPTDARQLLEPYLEAWAAGSELFDSLPISFQFTSHRSELEPGLDGVGYVDAAAITGAAINATAHAEYGQLPQPRPGVATAGVIAEQLRRRWRGMEEGREPVPATSYTSSQR
jgi:hypothetical protein